MNICRERRESAGLARSRGQCADRPAPAFSYRRAAVIAVFALAAIVGSATTIVADGLEDDVIDVVEEADQEMAVAGPVVGEEQFDQWMFSADGGNNTGSRQARARLETMSRTEIARVDQWCSLTRFQKAKLRLAARGDISRLFGRVAELRTRFLRDRREQQKLQQFYSDAQPVQTALQSLQFGRDSMFHKTLRQTLSREQSARYESADRERRLYRHRAQIGTAILLIEVSVPLEGGQRERLEQLIEKEVPLPDVSVTKDGMYFVLEHIRGISDDKLRTVFDAAQMSAWTRKLQKNQGILEQLSDNTRVGF